MKHADSAHWSDPRRRASIPDLRTNTGGAACGVAFVARRSGQADHELVGLGLDALSALEHRGAEGADATTGDGAGMTLQLPDELLRSEHPGLPRRGAYGVGMCFLPRDRVAREAAQDALGAALAEHGFDTLGWRDVPVEHGVLGAAALEGEPAIAQLLVAPQDRSLDADALEQRLFLARCLVERRAPEGLHVCSLSSRTVVYKGMLTASQLGRYFRDLRDERTASALALVHSRFSTNTLPAWSLAQPFRMLAHNGELNTVAGNRNWMRARRPGLGAQVGTTPWDEILPPFDDTESDSATLDRVLELLVRAGRSLPHAAMLLLPEVHEGRDDLPPELVDFYTYGAHLCEPWDGPAAITFTDGRLVGARLDRNGLRPGRWLVTHDGLVVLASEAGVLPIEDHDIARRGRLRPGRLFLVDVERHTVCADGEPELEVARSKPYRTWHREHARTLTDLAVRRQPASPLGSLRDRQLAFGYTVEDLAVLVGPTAVEGSEPHGSMGDDTPLPLLRDTAPSLFALFAQRFAQVTNPAIDPVRESLVMSLLTHLGTQGDLLAESPEHARQLVLDDPVLDDGQLAALRALDQDGFRATDIDITWPLVNGRAGLEPALERVTAAADRALERGANLLVLTDRAVSPERVAIPALLATAAMHHHLVRSGTRPRCSLIIDSGEPREVHHLACLIGFGAGAVNPYLLWETLDDLAATGELEHVASAEHAREGTRAAWRAGLLKILSKMGISTVASYRGAQTFEAVGLDAGLVERFFRGTPSRVGGVGLERLGDDALRRHARAWPTRRDDLLPVGGLYRWHREGERHVWNPETVTLLQDAVREGTQGAWEAYTTAVDAVTADTTLRGAMSLTRASEPLPLEEVESETSLVRRFTTGGMSLGSLSPESHATLAVAMNRLGGRSNTGEGGEDPARFTPDASGILRRSAIKQVASGRFGVTAHYLVNADELQIKISQGSKPGEGGQLPGHKVSPLIAELRHSTPGVGLISPPPHHDIYSIEDLKQLIHDLRCGNPDADVSVKLVAEAGVGTVAAGVAKANADTVIIAGNSGGTGSSPLSSIRSAGVAWELGVAEAQQTLVDTGLRSRIAVQTDGGLRTGRDVVIAAMLGAEQFAFSTAPLIANGCLMMRVCHLNTCPVGIATQDEQLRQRFTGTPEQIETFFLSMARQVRQLMASLGIARFEDLVGRVDLLRQRDDAPGDLELSALLDASHLEVEHSGDGGSRRPGEGDAGDSPGPPRQAVRLRTRAQEPSTGDAHARALVDACEPAIARGEPVTIQRPIHNADRSVGGLVSSAVARAHGAAGLPAGTIRMRFDGAAGQSFGTWLAAGIDLTLVGEANDYVGKGLSGGVLTVRPHEDAGFAAEENVIAGNTVLYGATAGRAFFRGQAGERFAIRNSGVAAVVEGVGDHGCEYMTGGRVVVLGPTGRNFAAGMSGGFAHVLDEDGTFASRCAAKEAELRPLDDDHATAVHALLVEHLERTGSRPARRLLEGWDELRGSIVTVVPLAYERALQELAGARQNPEADPAAPAAEDVA